MTLEQSITSIWAQRLSLLLLRGTTGFLLVWVGLAKLVTVERPSRCATSSSMR